ncbi:hypothetical protein JCM5353_006681 [Sporobolomyces roseus]
MQSPISPSSTLPLTSTGPSFPACRHWSPFIETPLAILHFISSLLFLLVSIPFHLTSHYIVFRSRSPSVQIGRHPVAFITHRFIRWSFGECYRESIRWIYKVQPFPSLWKNQRIERVEKGVWIRPPGTQRKEDDLVLYWIHGGAFTYNTIGSTLLFYKSLCSELNQPSSSSTSPIQFSIFLLDYHLAPEHPYPSQLISLELGYRYLTLDLGISASNICLGGDSAGGNLVISFLLHLARHNPLLPSPTNLEKPGSSILISPFVSLYPLSSRPSRTCPLTNTFDYLHTTTLTLSSYAYLSLPPPSLLKPSWNPFRWLGIAGPELLEAVELEELEGKWRDPWLNPDVEILGREDWEWFREAFPEGDELTCIIYGGMEIFKDDISSLLNALRTVGVNPLEIYEPFKTHDWPIFDFMLPFASRVKGGGENNERDYGLRKIAGFLRGIVKGDEKVWEKGDMITQGQMEKMEKL